MGSDQYDRISFFIGALLGILNLPAELLWPNSSDTLHPMCMQAILVYTLGLGPHTSCTCTNIIHVHVRGQELTLMLGHNLLEVSHRMCHTCTYM